MIGKVGRTGHSVTTTEVGTFCLRKYRPVNYLHLVNGGPEVVVLAKFHHSRGVKREIAERTLPVLQQHRRFTHVGLEAVYGDHQSVLDDYRRGKVNRSELVRLFRDHWGVLPEEYANIVEVAAELDMKCIALGRPSSRDTLTQVLAHHKGKPAEEMGFETDTWMALNTLNWRHKLRHPARMAVLCGALHGFRIYPRYVTLLEHMGIRIISLRLISTASADEPPFQTAIRGTPLVKKRWAVNLNLVPCEGERPAYLKGYDAWIHVPQTRD